MSITYDLKQMKLSHLLGQLLGTSQALIASLRYYGAPEDYTDKAQQRLDKLNSEIERLTFNMAISKN